MPIIEFYIPRKSGKSADRVEFDTDALRDQLEAAYKNPILNDDERFGLLVRLEMLSIFESSISTRYHERGTLPGKTILRVHKALASGLPKERR